MGVESSISVTLRKLIDVEALMWSLGLLILAASDPGSETHFTLFWPQWVFGIQSPGHGLGHSIGYLFRGDLLSSLNAHLLGVPVVIVLVHRITSLEIRRLRAVSCERNRRY